MATNKHYKPKHKTLCWECEWAGGKDKKCPWACKFEPVPGWEAVPTKIQTTDRIVDSFDVYACPLFELMYEIKVGIVANAGKKRHFNRLTEEEREYIKSLVEEGYSAYAIIDITGHCSKTVNKIVKEIKENKAL